MAFKKIITKPIGYELAAKHLDLLQQKREKVQFLSSAGGMFRLEEFKNWIKQENNFSGIMCWFCLDEDSNFFLAIEPRFNFKYDESSLDQIEPICEKLIIPNQILSNEIFEGDRLDFVEIERRLRSFKEDMPVIWKKEATNEEVFTWKENFKRSVQNSTELSTYGFTYFSKEGLDGNPYLNQFLNQPKIKMVRYYFGLWDYEFNKLRVILVPVNWKGQNISPEKNYILGDDNLLQFSWPPPPDNF
jgi:hypothetical protein